MNPFLDEEFLLQSKTARELFHDYAESLPVIDYHCHINPQEIAEDRVFDNIAQVWLGGDHYKWRMIRSNGVPEEEITGSASDRIKFQRFAETLPKAIGNPLYHWTHLELKRYFGYNEILNADTAEEVWNLCNETLKTLSVRKIIERSGVTTIVTTDDPADDLKWHKVIREDDSFKTDVLPAWRPDQAMNLEKPEFPSYLKRLSQVSGVNIENFADLKTALDRRLDFFDSMGCRASDHGLNDVIYAPAPEKTVDAIMRKALCGESLSRQEIDEYKYAVLCWLGREYAKRGWIMQLHYGTLRNANTALYEKLGPDTGFDCIGTTSGTEGLVRFLDTLDHESSLPKTIIYSLNPNDNAAIGTVIGCFQGTEAAGKLQHGAAWWFNDTKTGMEAQLTSLANLSVLGNFVGMLTDSRSFLSYTRHEYFRRILCNLIGGWVENGEYPNDREQLKEIIEGISYYNAKKYFGF